jgi:single-stranded-DNA-specific exonuclease
MTDSPREAQGLAAWLEQKNAERQRLTAKVQVRAREQVLAKGITPLLIAADSDYPLGIAGLVAGRLAEEFYRPSIVIRTGEKLSGGSARSIPEFNIIEAITGCSRLLSHFGGHSQAAGFTLPTRNLPQFERYLARLAEEQLKGADLRPRLDIDTEASLANLSGDTFNAIQKLSPFGRGNPAPTFLSRQVDIIDCRTMGNGAQHLRLKLRQGGTVWDGVGFGLGCYLAEISPRLDIVFNLEIDRWQGRENLRLNILDFAPSS